MNLPTAKGELGEPPKVGIPLLLLEAAGLFGLSYLLVNLLG